MRLNKKFIFGLLTGFFCFLLIYFLMKNNDCDGRADIIKQLSRQAARWSTASVQDKSPLIAVLHANYGAGYLWALKDIATHRQIKNATGIDLAKFTEEIVKIQDASTVKMIKLCPAFAPPTTYLSKIGGENI